LISVGVSSPGDVQLTLPGVEVGARLHPEKLDEVILGSDSLGSSDFGEVLVDTVVPTPKPLTLRFACYCPSWARNSNPPRGSNHAELMLKCAVLSYP